jgi:hypothetical protein
MEFSGLNHLIAIAAGPQRNPGKSPKEPETDLFLPPRMQSWYAGIEGVLLPSTLVRKGAV